MKIMHAILFALCGLFVIILDRAIAFAQASMPAVDPSVAAHGLIAAIQSHTWTLAVSFGLMLFIWAAGRFNLLAFLPAKATPWVSIVLGVVGAVATSVATGHPMGESLAAGVQAGLAGVGAWEALGKNVLPAAATPPTPPAAS